HGRPAALPLVLGVMMGDALAVTLSLLGLGALLAASSLAFSVVKWVGALYLIYLGISLWRAPVAVSSNGELAGIGRSAKALFMHAFLVTTFNPKGIVFFVAFLPQFVDPQGNVPFQLFLLGATFVVIGTANAALYAIFSGTLKKWLASEMAGRWFNRCGGTALVGAGAFTAMVQRN
ncbi:MAG: LysE family translocator, partial [Pseudomonadota bacterium]